MTIPLDGIPQRKMLRDILKKYSKAKTAVVEKKIQLKETEKEIDYLDSVLTFIDNAEKVTDLDDIREELVENGVLRRRNLKEKQKKHKIQPIEYFTSTGKRILVGRNNRENDILTFKTASSREISGCTRRTFPAPM